MICPQVLSGQKAIALDTAPTVQGNAEDCEEERLQSTEEVEQVQVRVDVFKRLQRAFGRIGWSLRSIDGSAVVASNATRGLLSVCPHNRAASALLRTLEG